MDGDRGMLLEEKLKNNKNRLTSLVIFLISLILDLPKLPKSLNRCKTNRHLDLSNNLNRTWMNGHLEIITLITTPLLTNQFNPNNQLKLKEQQLIYLIYE